MTAANSNSRWYRITWVRVVVVLLIIEGLLSLADRFQSFAINRPKEYYLAIGVAGLALALVVMLISFLASLVTRRRIQFSISSLLLLTPAVAIPFGWLTLARDAAMQQRDVVEEIRTAGGVITYDYQLPPDVAVPERPTPPGPRWLRNVLGDDLFVNVTEVDLSNSNFDEAVLRRFRALPQLRSLALSNNASDAALENIKGLTRLQRLSLARSKITDAGLRNLEGLTELRMLNLDQTSVTDSGLRFLEGLTRLHWLCLARSKVTGAGLQHLEGLTQLEWLDLEETKVSDLGLEHLEGLTRLHELLLSGTNVSDAGLQHLGRLTHLKLLSLVGTHVTDAGFQRLQQALPNYRNHYGASQAGVDGGIDGNHATAVSTPLE